MERERKRERERERERNFTDTSLHSGYEWIWDACKLLHTFFFFFLSLSPLRGVPAWGNWMPQSGIWDEERDDSLQRCSSG